MIEVIKASYCPGARSAPPSSRWPSSSIVAGHFLVAEPKTLECTRKSCFEAHLQSLLQLCKSNLAMPPLVRPSATISRASTQNNCLIKSCAIPSRTLMKCNLTELPANPQSVRCANGIIDCSCVHTRTHRRIQHPSFQHIDHMLRGLGCPAIYLVQRTLQ